VSHVFQVVARLLRLRVLRELGRSRFFYVVLLFIAVWITSSLLFYYSEHIVAGRSDIDLWASLYWSIITMATIGYGDITPVRGLGWVVAGITAVAGIAVYSLTISVIADMFLSRTISRAMGLRPLKGKSIIVIGDSGACIQIIDELRLSGYTSEVGFLTPEQPPSPVDVEYFIGDPGDERVLRKAGVDKARHIFICMSDDSKTLHVALLVRYLNNSAEIYALTNKSETRDLLREINVKQAISTEYFGRVLASALFEPTVLATLLDVISKRGLGDLVEVVVGDEYSGKTIGEVEASLNRDRDYRYRVIALFRDPRHYVIAPDQDIVLEKGNRLVVVKGARRVEH